MLKVFRIALVYLTLVNGFFEDHSLKRGEMEVHPSIFPFSLIGKWKGYAISTPIGKVPYDLHFELLDKHTIQGISSTNGQAIHTWIFQSGPQGQLQLDFHSTFGDSWAKGLSLSTVNENRYLFSNGTPSYLSVWIKLTKQDEMHIDIWLREQPHVSILVTRN